MEVEADGLLLTDTTVDDYKGFQVAVIKGDRISRLQSKEAVWETWSGGQPMPQGWVTDGEKGVITIQSRRLCRGTALISRSVSSPELACSGCQVDASCRVAFHPSRTSLPIRKKRIK